MGARTATVCPALPSFQAEIDDLFFELRAIDWHIFIFPTPSVDWICLFKRPGNYRDRWDVVVLAQEGE
jgi:hypothetical protein